VEGAFTTVEPADIVRATINIGDGRTVGVAAPIQIQFDGHVDDRAAVERALSVTTSVPVEGSWGWLADENGGSRVHWRPEEYWPSGTRVTVAAKLFGVPYGGGDYGKADVSSSFTIGRAQIVKADVNSHRMLVFRDGRQVADYPASYGLESDPRRVTRSGTHIVMSKHESYSMSSQTYGYENVVVPWAVRISNNGEFIHGYAPSIPSQGKRNVSHGCANLSPDNAKLYFDTAMIGDPVEVIGSTQQLGPQDGDYHDWTIPWDQWLTKSA
jgi:lipoprotein-anchoring transpeptidase ErfK/SrfK